MIIDAHHHLWQPERGYRWLDEPELAAIRRPFTPADLTAELAAAGVDRTVLVEGGRCHTDEAAEFLGHAADTPAIAGVVAWIDVAALDLAATIARYRSLRGGELLAGVRAQIQGEAVADYPAVLAALREALPPLSQQQLQDIFAGTAMRTYGLADRVRPRTPA